MNKLAIISTHPVQYYVPVFQLLYQEPNLKVKVFYTYSQRQHDAYDKDFGLEIKWDIPLLEGYESIFVDNTARKPGLDHFGGIKCPHLIREIESWGATHVLIFGWNYQAHFKAMRHFKGKIPVWFRGDSTLLDERPGFKKILRRLFLRCIYTYVDKAFYVGTNSKKYFKAHGLKENQLVFAPHAIDNKRFEDSKEKKIKSKAQQLKSNLGFSQNDFVILYVGKFEPRKNLLFLIRAFQSALTSHLIKKISPKLVLVGGGPLEEELKKETSQTSQIEFISFQNQSQLPIFYRMADVLCLPSKSETWGLVVNEAMASGRPVLASNKVGSAIDLIKEGETGYIFKTEDPKSFEEKLKLCLNSDLEELGMNAKKEIQNWSFEAIKEAIKKELI